MADRKQIEIAGALSSRLRTVMYANIMRTKTMPPIIDADKCIRCGKCVDTCAEDVYFGSKKKEIPNVTYPQECAYCNACVEECPVEGAIRLRVPLPMMVLYKPAS